MAHGYRKTLGDWGEKVARSYLEKQGYQILEGNFHTRLGEIDLIACKDDRLTFVEVKTRSNHAYGLGEEAINAKKLQAMLASIQTYLDTARENAQVEWQIDVLIVEGHQNDAHPLILHYENIGEEAL